MKLLTENYNQQIHGYLKERCDAFGNEINPEEGYRFLEGNEIILKGDKHFDIYTGWTSGNEDFYVRNGHHAYFSGGRWTAWERKI